MAPNPNSVPYLLATLEELNLTQDTELSTFYGITNYIFETFKDETSQSALSEYIKDLSEENIDRFLNKASELPVEAHEQKISTELISFTELDDAQYDQNYMNLLTSRREAKN